MKSISAHNPTHKVIATTLSSRHAKKILRRYPFWTAEAILKAAAGFRASDILDAAANGGVRFVMMGLKGKYVPVEPDAFRKALYYQVDKLFDPSLDAWEMIEKELRKHLPKGMTLDHAMVLTAQAHDAEVASIVAKVRAERANEVPAAPIQEQEKRGAQAAKLPRRRSTKPVQRVNTALRVERIRELATQLMEEDRENDGTEFFKGTGQPDQSALGRRILSLSRSNDSRTANLGTLSEHIVRKALLKLKAPRDN
jgi:hypothetical protein